MKKKLSLFLFLFVFLLLISQYIMYYADDFYYIRFTKGDFSNFVNMHVEHYFTWNGRAIVNILATIFLGIPHIYWQVLMPTTLTFLAYLIYKLATFSYNTNSEHTQVSDIFPILISISGIALINITVARQAEFCLTGFFNYTYPIVLLLLFLHLLNKSFLYNKSFFLPAVAFLAGATVEQGGMMAFGGFMLTVLYFALWEKIKPRPIHIITGICVTLGVLTVMLAPGIFHRFATQSRPVDGGLLNLINYNIPYIGKMFFLSNYMIECHALVLVTCALLLFSQKKKLLSFVAVLTMISLVCFAFVRKDLLKPLSPLEIVLVLTTVMSYIAVMTYVSVYLLKQKGNPISLIATILGFGSIFMILISPDSGPRVLIPFIFMAILFCATTITYVTLSSKLIFVISIATFLGSCVNLGYIWNGFKNNYPVYKHNIVLINEYKASLKTNKKVSLVQKQLPDPIFGWSMPYRNKFFIPYYNKCFDLPNYTKINWQEYTQK